MKHLKLFESTDPYYEKISRDEFNWYEEMPRYPINISKSTLKKIESLMDKSRILFYRTPFDFLKIKTYGVVPFDVSIYEHDDEWFYVIKSGISEPNYYKCDQFEGLVRLLKDLKVI